MHHIFIIKLLKVWHHCVGSI